MEYKQLSRLIYLAAGLFVAIWFAHQVIDVILLLFFAIVITIVLNAPVGWLVQRKMSRTAASLLVFFGVLTAFTLIGWAVIPKVVTQVKLLIDNLPAYVERLNEIFAGWIGKHAADKGEKIQSIVPMPTQLQPIINSIGQFSITLFKNILLIIFFFCLVIYMLLNPRPLLEMYLSCFPDNKKDKAAQAFSNASTMTIGWMWSIIVAGALRATIVWFFLYFMDIPGVWVWAGVTFFAELIPKIGFYIMSVPVVLIAFSISPSLGLWVSLFYIVLDEIIGDFILPRIRSKTMKIHPVSLLVLLLAMTAAFGVMGAFIATPLAAFVKAYYEVFYQKKVHAEEKGKLVNRMLLRE
jgi:putative permease